MQRIKFQNSGFSVFKKCLLFFFSTFRSIKNCNRYGVYFVIYFLSAIVVLTNYAYGSHNNDPVPNESTFPVSRQIKYSFTLQNRTDHLLKEVEFWTYAPVKETSTQRTIKLDVSHPYELIEDSLGNQVLHFTFKNMPPFATKIITIAASLELSEISNVLPEKDIRGFLKPEKYIESDDPELAGFANKFTSAEPAKTARNIFTWVADNLEYTGYLKDNHGALYALKNKKGDCTEYMSLFVAFSRANNVPARGIGGYIVTANAILKPYEYHNWAEFYDDGVWKIVDPQNKVFMQDQSHYIAMRIIGGLKNNPMGDFDRYRSAGDGLKVQMNY